MKSDNNLVDYKEDLKALKKSIETVRKLEWNNDKKSNKRKMKNTAERNAA